MDKKIREEQIIFLQQIKPLLNSIQTQKDVSQEITDNSPDDRMVKLNELIERIENIEKILDNQEEEGVRKSKVKDQIIPLLQQNKKLTASQLSKLIGLSRTRCSEYFRELTKDGLTEGVIINRQKYYKLVAK